MNGESLFQARQMTVVKLPEGVQISVGQPHDFRSEDLSDAEVMRLVAVLRLAVSEET